MKLVKNFHCRLVNVKFTPEKPMDVSSVRFFVLKKVSFWPPYNVQSILHSVRVRECSTVLGFHWKTEDSFWIRKRLTLQKLILLSCEFKKFWLLQLVKLCKSSNDQILRQKKKLFSSKLKKKFTHPKARHNKGEEKVGTHCSRLGPGPCKGGRQVLKTKWKTNYKQVFVKNSEYLIREKKNWIQTYNILFLR